MNSTHIFFALTVLANAPIFWPIYHLARTRGGTKINASAHGSSGHIAGRFTVPTCITYSVNDEEDLK